MVHFRVDDHSRPHATIGNVSGEKSPTREDFEEGRTMGSWSSVWTRKNDFGADLSVDLCPSQHLAGTDEAVVSESAVSVGDILGGGHISALPLYAAGELPGA